MHSDVLPARDLTWTVWTLRRVAHVGNQVDQDEPRQIRAVAAGCPKGSRLFHRTPRR
jgi:hypothetical protein